MGSAEANQTSRGAGQDPEKEAENHAAEMPETGPKDKADESSHHRHEDLLWACIWQIRHFTPKHIHAPPQRRHVMR